jgi:hypothetical protein
MHIIMGMPPHIIIIGMPAPIMVIMRWQHSLNISMDMPSPGMTLQVMALPDISQLIFIIGTAIGIMPGIIPGIIPPIMGIPPIIGIMPGIMDMPGIIGIIPPIMGIMPGIIGMLAGMAPVGICIAVFIVVGSLLRCRLRLRVGGGGEFVGPVLKSRSRPAQQRSRRRLHFAPMK